jgi:hypothetical protein
MRINTLIDKYRVKGISADSGRKIEEERAC